MKRDTAKGLRILIWIIAVIMIIIFDFLGSKSACLLTLAAACVIDLILGKFLRCPHCGRGLGRNWLFDEHCPYCGEYLDDK